MALCDLMYVVDGRTVKAGTVDTSRAKLAVIMGTAATVGALSLLGVYIEIDGKAKSGYMKKSDVDALNPSAVTIPANFAGLEAEMVPTRLQDQLFRVVDVVENEDYVEVTARHVWYDNLKDFTLWKPTADTDYTAAAVCRNILSNAISPVDSRVASDCTDTLKGDQLDYQNKNLVECFLDPENGVCAQFDLSLIRDNWDFYCLRNVGYDRGMVIENGKNLLGVERKENIENLATRIAPYGKDKKGNIIWLDHNGLKYIDSQYIGDYSCPHVELYDTGLQIGKDGVTAANIQAKLLEEGQKRFTDDKVDLPSVEMTISFISLGDTEEYIQYRGLDKVYLYDIITIHDTVRGYSYTAQVVGIEHDILTGMLNSVTIGKLDNWDGTRKIATWQVPEINGENIRLLSIQAGAFAPGAIYGEDIAEAVISYAHFAAATINHLTADSIEAVTAQIHEIIAGSITADDITAGSITTETLAANAVTAQKIAAEAITSEKIHAEAVTAAKIAAAAVTTDKLDANAVTAAKIAAGAITAEKIAAGAISASKIDTTDLEAINATLGTANIADARIGIADINFAHIKDLNAQSAYFGQTVFQEALGGKLYVPRLAANYAQIVNATISDLVIQASNDNYYKLDIDLSGNVTATQVTPSAAEIAQGHTSDGRTIYMGTDILATDLNTQNIYASHALMDEITANILNVDQLFAREATIGKINALDLSSNTYIQATIGTWESGSTITQTINSINSRISQLGYGTIFYSETEPSHENLVIGDIWVQPVSDNTWDDIAEYTWDELSSMTWEQVAGQYRMYTWTGVEFKILFDNLFVSELQTEINQTAYAVTLKADQSAVDTLSGQVTEFSAELEIQGQAITAAVATVNAKASVFVQYDDPGDTYELHIGDTWIRDLNGNGTWDEVGEFTWNELADYTWDEIAGAETFVWNGTEWVKTSDEVLEINLKTVLQETSEKLEMEATARMQLGEEVINLSSRLTITATAIESEVIRATNAENSKIAKTNIYQTADDIVTAAENYFDGILTDEAAIRTSATGITAYVAHYTGDNFYEIRSGIDIKAAGIEISGAKYIKIKSGGLFQVESGNFGVDASGNVTMTGTITATSITANSGGTIAGWTISANLLSSGSGNGYVALSSDPNGTYAIWAGNQTAANAAFWVKRDGSAKFAGTIAAAAGSTLGGWTLGSTDLHSGSGGSYIALASSGTYAMWAGAENSAAAPFRLKPDGTVYLTKLIALAENGTETTVNLRTAGLWKLSYSTVKSHTASSLTLTDGTTINFTKAADLSIGTSGGGTVYIVKDGAQYGTASASVAIKANATSYALNTTTGDLLVTADVMMNGTSVIRSGDTTLINILTDLQAQYNAGYSAGQEALKTALTIGTSGSGTVYIVKDGSQFGTASASIAISANATGYSLNADTGDLLVTANVMMNGTSVIRTGDTTLVNILAELQAKYSSGYSDGQSVGWSTAYNKCGNSMSGGKLTITRPGPSYNSQVTDKYKVAGLSTYARAGQTAYTYEQGRYVSFTIPSDCKTGSAYITTDT